MKVLLCGSSGIVCKYLLPFLRDNPSIDEIVGVSRRGQYYLGNHPNRGSKYIEVESQLDKKEWAFRLISELRPTHILNFAGISTSSSPVFDIWQNNPGITLNLLESCVALKHKVKFFQASSFAVENVPLNVYAASKLACENLIYSYNQLYPELIQGILARWCAVVGSNNKHGLLADIVNKLRVPGETITLFGEQPGSRKPFIYGKNLAEILNSLFFTEEKFWNWSNYRIAPTDSLTVEKVANIAMNRLNIYKDILWDKDKVWRGDQPIVFPSVKHNYFDGRILSSEMAIKKALEDILNEN